MFANSRFERGSQGALGQSGYQLAVSMLAVACKACHMRATSDYHWYYCLSQKISRVSDTYSSVNSSISPASSRSTLRSLSVMRSRGEWNISIIQRRPRPINIWDAVNLRSQLSVYHPLSEILIRSRFRPWFCYCSLSFQGLVLTLPSSSTFWFRGAGFIAQRHVSVLVVGVMLDWTSPAYNAKWVDDTRWILSVGGSCWAKNAWCCRW